MAYRSLPDEIPASAYDRDYYLKYMNEAEEFARLDPRQDNEDQIPERLKIALDLGQLQPGMRVLDIGCGRGEFSWFCARRQAHAWGMDYSPASMEIASRLMNQAVSAGLSMQLVQASAGVLPLAENTFDRAFMLDIIEHLTPLQLQATLEEVHRLLHPGGRLVIHTMPNLDYYRWGYPLYRLFNRLAGRRIPADPRQRWYRGETHVNIQSPRLLRQALQQIPFSSIRVWLHPLYGSRLKRWLISWPFWRGVLVNDILGVAIK